MKVKRLKKANKKKEWSKHIDVSEVDEYLEDQRLEERLGGPFSSRPNEALFTFDYGKKKVEKKKRPALVVKQKQGVSLLDWKSLRCYSSLLSSSAVKPLGMIKDEVKETKEKNLWTSKRARKQASDKQSSQKKMDKRTKPPSSGIQKLKDIWASDEKDLLENEWIGREAKDNLRANGGRKLTVAKHLLVKPSPLPAISSPHPGMSYNPTFDDHQALLQKAADIEMEKLEEERKIQRRTTKYTPLPPGTWLKEMSEGLPGSKDKQVEEEKNEAAEEEVVKAPVKPDYRKTAKQRRKEKKVKDEQLVARKRKEERKRLSDVFRLRSLQKMIAAKEKKTAARQEARAKRKLEASSCTRVLGKHRFQDAELELNLRGELAGSLIKLKQEGNLLLDRFKSLQRRNILEPRIKTSSKRKYHLKTFVRKSHKEKWEVKNL